jgi:hypothetical protein
MSELCSAVSVRFRFNVGVVEGYEFTVGDINEHGEIVSISVIKKEPDCYEITVMHSIPETTEYSKVEFHNVKEVMVVTSITGDEPNEYDEVTE